MDERIDRKSARRVLMVGFHFPPSALSSGHLRLLAFTRYLPAFGWDPVVLSATGCAYEHVDAGSVDAIPAACPVHRALALDAKRHLGIAGRYPSVLAQPDRWASWRPSAVGLGWRLLRRYDIQAIWSTYPIMSAHCIAHALHRMSGIPWIADFRDPVATSLTGRSRMTARSLSRWERRVVARATCSVFTTSGAMQSCAGRHPDIYRDRRLAVIENGYDEAAFADMPSAPRPPAGRPLVLVHSGLLYPDGRSPVPFFNALGRLRAAGSVNADNLRIVLRASGSEAAYRDALQGMGLEGMVELAPPVSGREALEEQAGADALLLFQGEKYDLQIPAKLYEYMRIGRPIFALVGERGDTAALLRGTGGAELVALDDVDAIVERLPAFLQAVREGNAPRVSPDVVARYSRRGGAALLANLLDRVVARSDAPIPS